MHGDVLGHEPPVSLHDPEINLSLLQTPVCLASLCVGNIHLH